MDVPDRTGGTRPGTARDEDARAIVTASALPVMELLT
jgi:hypothetical protein